MTTECNQEPFPFHPLNSEKSAGSLTADSGARGKNGYTPHPPARAWRRLVSEIEECRCGMRDAASERGGEQG
jgi:hypothetical protein